MSYGAQGVKGFDDDDDGNDDYDDHCVNCTVNIQMVCFFRQPNYSNSKQIKLHIYILSPMPPYAL
jgi:hypothetical protein